MIEFHENDSVSLYNLQEDPGEQNDLAAALPQRAAELRAELNAWQAGTDAPVPKLPNPQCILEDAKLSR